MISLMGGAELLEYAGPVSVAAGVLFATCGALHYNNNRCGLVATFRHDCRVCVSAFRWRIALHTRIHVCFC